MGARGGHSNSQVTTSNPYPEVAVTMSKQAHEAHAPGQMQAAHAHMQLQLVKFSLLFM